MQKEEGHPHPRKSFPHKEAWIRTRDRKKRAATEIAKRTVFSLFWGGGGRRSLFVFAAPFLAWLPRTPTRQAPCGKQRGRVPECPVCDNHPDNSQSWCGTTDRCINSPASPPTGTTCPDVLSLLAPRWVCCPLIYAHPCLSVSLPQGNTTLPGPSKAPTAPTPPTLCRPSSVVGEDNGKSLPASPHSTLPPRS